MWLLALNNHPRWGYSLQDTPHRVHKGVGGAGIPTSSRLSSSLRKTTLGGGKEYWRGVQIAEKTALTENESTG